MEIKNIEDLKLEEITEEYLVEMCEEMGQELEVDTRQGSLYRDASAGHIVRIAKFFDNLRSISKIISLNTCTGEILDEYMKMRGLVRNPLKATPAKYHVNFTGTTPPVGSVMTCAGHFFSLKKEEEELILVSEELGTDMNNLLEGELVIPETDVDGLISATLGKIAIPALNIESDDSARRRLHNRMSGPDENGNKSHIRTWCESVEGVGRARVIPLWKGDNTVAAVIISKDGDVPTKEIIDNVQGYLDPGATGMGEGMATIGQFFTALSAQPVEINVSVTVTKSSSTSYSEIQESFKRELTEYLKSIATIGEFSEDVKVRYNRVGAILSNMETVVDYENLLVNEGTENVSFNIYQIPVIGEVTVNGDIS